MSSPMKAQAPKKHGPFGGGHGPVGAPTEKAKDFKGSMGKLLRYLGRYKIRVAIVLVFAMLSTVFMIVGPKILGTATTEMFNGIMGKIAGTGTGIDFGRILQIILFLLTLYLISLAFSYIQGWVMTGVSMRVTYNLRNDIMKKINRMPLNYFDTTSHGEVLSRVTNDVDTLSQTLNQSITQIITSVTTIVGILIMMFSISWQLTLVALCIIPVSLIFILQIVKRSQKYFSAQQEYLGHVNGHVEEMYGGHMVMKAFNGEEASVQEFDSYNETLYHSAWKSQFLSGLMMPVMNFVANVGYVVVCIIGGWLASGGRLDVGGIQAFIQYVRQFTQPITQVANISNILQQTAAAAERVFEFLEEPEETPDVPIVHINDDDGVPDSDSLIHIHGSVQFAHVKFGYNPNKTIINDFSANILPGQKVAIVGPTGAGKTTMVKLLMRFYDVNEGAILIDGYDIRNFSRDELRSVFGMVLQDTWLYNGTIRENIRYGRLDADNDEVKVAAKAAQVHHFVRTLPGAYDMVLNEEASNVSQGQKQLLTIARAILSDPKILILDEATSSVDTRTEVLIQKAMDNLMKGRTSFVIAHRLSTIRDADLILCMKDGDIVEQGTHDELMAKNGFYANLYNSQFEKVSTPLAES
ncbi:ABC transporter ATP-binding protein [Anaeromassilibacillus senegalensis]|uniref:ABC transporter ATP-binding protein n=1 Tax=Anaeromassilibacillus senegalensis TaxID=1673717 RepID=UPI000682E362|nr:ABC transporter ATP-binding protein [Anaeromassilibacillus senegalensis]